MSRLEENILRGLNLIGYNGPLLQKTQLPVAIEGGPKNVEYTQLVNFLTNEIRTLLAIDEEVNAVTSPEDSVAFVMEITSFLKELNCPYTALTDGLVSDRLQNVSDRLLLLDYLITELMGARILQEKKPEKKIELKLQETPEGADMRLILQTLRFPKPPPNISITTLFQKLCPTIPIVLNKAGADIVGEGIFKGFLSEKQWEILGGIQKDLYHEYKIRREMLLTRLDVTIQSFQWSDRTKGKNELFEKIYHDKRKLLKVEPEIDMADLIAARTDLAIIEKTSNSSVRKNTRSQLQKVIIGQVPDRGGRTSEIAPPPPEMPPWQQRSSGGGRGGFTRGGGNMGGGHQSRGGYNQGNYGNNTSGGYNRGGRDSHSSSDNYQGNYRGQDNSNQGNYGNNASGGYNKGGRDSYGSSDNYQGNYRGQDNFNQGSYGHNTSGGYNRGGRGGYGNSDNYQGNYRSQDNSNYGEYGNKNYTGARDRGGGSYSSQDYQQTKRAKTYDSFQANKSTYADEYVQENQQNQQYHARGDNRKDSGRGRSNYHRGGGGGSYR